MLDFIMTHLGTTKRWNYKKTNWEKFEEMLKHELATMVPLPKLHTNKKAKELTDYMYKTILTAHEKHVPFLKINENTK